ncbi:hypothetical protein PQC65_gp235 [Aeromonas phage pAEv1810]|uniref:hypothetical protein n=1 Tax=Aeromonas phage pAEv1810 TaxID=2908744 RepID=UPI00232951BC|nr:hypothetical protein PQC65_gp235 [Aeromonas phage pAEv1810]UIS25173.1 hypothetical protein pAEv1810_235 [Aeromonas phage pAEv1810]
MNVFVSDVEHFQSLLAGFESLDNDINAKDGDAAYTRTCLSLNGVSFNQYAGNEGFVQTIKDGAVKFYEMIKSWLKSIKEFFFGAAGAKQDQQVAKTVKAANELPGKINKALAAMSPEEREKAEAKLKTHVAKLDPETVVHTVGLRKMNDIYLIDKDGLMKDIKGTAEKIKADFPDLSSDLSKINTLYQDMGKLVGKKVEADVKSLTEAATLCAKIAELRSAFKSLQAKVTPALEKSNEQTKKLAEGKVENEQDHRYSKKVTNYLANLSSHTANCIKSCSKSIGKMAVIFKSVALAVLSEEQDIFDSVMTEESVKPLEV